MTDDLISREAALAAIPNGWTGEPHQSNMEYGPTTAVKAVSAIRALPAAQVQVPDGLIEALRRGEQADADGCRVKVSRQACEEAASILAALSPAQEQDPPALHRSFPEAGDGRPLPPMVDELMTAGLSAVDAHFVAVQLAQNGLTLVNADAIEAQDARIKVLEEAIRWNKTIDGLPKKPGARDYEQIECLIKLPNGDIEISMWNCEHEVWDDAEGDDYRYDPHHPSHWLALAPIRAAISPAQGANLRGADLEGVDLEGVDLEGADLRGADLDGANLRGAIMSRN